MHRKLLRLADWYSSKAKNSKIALDPIKADNYNKLALYYNYPKAIEYFIEHSEGVHKEFFKFQLK